MQTIKPFTFFCCCFCCLFLSASGLLAHDLAPNPKPAQADGRQDRRFDELSTDKSCVCPAVCEMDLPLGGRAYLLGRKVLHNIYAGKWPTIYKDTRHFGTSFWPAVVANKMNFLNARQSRKLQFPIAKQSNLIKRIPNAILVCVWLWVCCVLVCN